MMQAEAFLTNTGAAQALSFIVATDPIFAKFMKEECGVDLDKISEMSLKASEVLCGLKNEDGIDPAVH